MARMEKEVPVESLKYFPIKIQDDNNQMLNLDFDKVTSIIEDCSQETYHYAKDKVKLLGHKVSIQDSVGNNINVQKYLSSINDSNSSTKVPEYIDVVIEATHDGQNLNCEVYHAESMEKDCNTFTQNYNKPMLLNHNTRNCSPVGRIQESTAKPSVIVANKTAVSVTARIYDQDAIIKILDGRYNTVSIGGNASTITCNYCGATIVKDGKFQFCGHYRGNSYKDQQGVEKLCTWSFEDIVYQELSFVNCPADVYAQVVNIKIPSEELNDFKTQDSDNNDSKIASIVDGILGNPVTAIADNNEPQQPTQQPTGNIVDKDNEIKQLNDEIKSLKDTVSQKDNEINDLKSKVTDSESKDAEIKVLKDQVVEKDKDRVDLANEMKSNLIDSIVSIEIVKGKLSIENRDSRTNELNLKSYTDLIKDYKSLDITPVLSGKDIPHVNDNKGLNNPNEGNIITDNKNEEEDYGVKYKEAISSIVR